MFNQINGHLTLLYIECVKQVKRLNFELHGDYKPDWSQLSQLYEDILNPKPTRETIFSTGLI